MNMSVSVVRYIALLALSQFLLVAASASDSDLAGEYESKGTSPGGGTYTAEATITKRSDVYDVEWIVSNGEKYSGIGILVDGKLAVGYRRQSPDDPTFREDGVIVYRIDNSGDALKLEGTFAQRWFSSPETETLTKKP